MTAVEWFATEIKGGKLITNQKFKDLVEQAKEIQKRQHEDTWDTAIKAGKAEAGGSGSNVNWIEFEEHWEKTFKSK